MPSSLSQIEDNQDRNNIRPDTVANLSQLATSPLSTRSLPTAPSPWSVSALLKQGPLSPCSPSQSHSHFVPLLPFPTPPLNPSPLPHQPQHTLTEAEKRRERQIKNRQAADASRKRKREHVVHLETLSASLVKENQELKAKLAQVESKNSNLTNRVEELQRFIHQLNQMAYSNDHSKQDIISFLSIKCPMDINDTLKCKDVEMNLSVHKDPLSVMEKEMNQLFDPSYSSTHVDIEHGLLDSLVHTELFIQGTDEDSGCDVGSPQSDSSLKTRLHCAFLAFFFSLSLLIFPYQSTPTQTVQLLPSSQVIGKEVLVRPGQDAMGLVTTYKRERVHRKSTGSSVPSSTPKWINSLALHNLSTTLQSFSKDSQDGVGFMARVLGGLSQHSLARGSGYRVEHALQGWSLSKAQGVYVVPSSLLRWQCSNASPLHGQLDVYPFDKPPPIPPPSKKGCNQFSMIATVSKSKQPLYFKFDLQVTQACVIEL